MHAPVMKQSRLPLRVLLALALASSLALLDSSRLAAASMNTMEKLCEGNAAFAVDLYQRAKSGNENLFFSPYSLSSALAMTYTGASGQTASEMAATLHFNLAPTELLPAFGTLGHRFETIDLQRKVTLSVANSLWLQRGHQFRKEFLATGWKSFRAELSDVDFAHDVEGSRTRINKWVAGKTADKIPELLKAGVLDPRTMLVLCNAIYFNGNWAVQFNPGWTHPDKFFVTPGNPVQVAMMSQQAKIRSASLDGFTAFELPYQGGDLSMVILLPEDQSGLPALEAKLNGAALNSWLNSLRRASETKTDVQLPRFKLSSQLDLAQTLSAMGMPTAFGNQADFSGIDGSRELFIGAVVHQAVVEVNEQGTEAAAATAVTMTKGAVPKPLPLLRVDHPFVFLIRESETDSILFLGRVVDPTK